MSEEIRNVKVRELERIATINGGILRAEDVVEAAKNIGNPLHTTFEWDDTVAGHQFRLLQARNLIRVTIQYLDETPEEPVKVYVSLQADREKEGGGYRFLTSVLADDDMSAALLRESLRDMKLFKKKYQQLSALRAVFASMAEVETKIEQKSIIEQIEV